LRAGFKSLAIRTTTPHGRLMSTMLPGMAEFERDLILQRTNEGQVRALLEGIRFGRTPKLTRHQTREALKRVEAGERGRALLKRRSLNHQLAQGTVSR